LGFGRTSAFIVYSNFANNIIGLGRVTEPEAFVLEIFFNAHPISGDPKQKQKATNVLVPTSVAYAGGYADFAVDMGNEVCLFILVHLTFLYSQTLVCISSHDSKGGLH
jgi:hypothetical protein